MRINIGIQSGRLAGRRIWWPDLLLALLFMVSPVMASEWAPVGDMGLGRSDTNAVRLNNGRVLFGVQLYDPSTGQWTSTQGSTSGYLATLTLLNDGRVLKAGHYDLFWFGAQPYAQLYDPNMNTWSDTSNSNFGHGGNLAVRLNDGKVLVVGNRDGSTAAEIFDPDSESWTAVGNMNTAHVDGFIELLPSGKVIVGGGVAGAYSNTAASIEFFSPNTGNWTLQANPPGLWRYPASVRLNDGRILVTNNSSSFLYDAASNSWTTAADLNVAHWGGASLTVLADGQVLIAGGFDSAGYIGNAAEVYNPMIDVWTRISDMPENRFDHGAALLENGHVLLAGGSHTEPTCCELSSAILYTPPGSPEPPMLPPPPPPAPTPIHISDIDNVSDGGTLQWVPRVKFTVVDNNNNPVGAALVTGEWSNGLTGTASCSTINDGTCTIANLSYPKIADVPDPVFTVTDISRVDMVYDATANSDPDGDSDGTTITVYAPTPPLAPSLISISDLDGSSVATNKHRWRGTTVITVSDDLGERISNAVVSGSWSGAYSGSTECTTDSNGTCSVVTGNIKNSKSSVTFTVSHISHATLTYDAAYNSDPDSDSDGTSITVNRP
jgi:hypothetical protein